MSTFSSSAKPPSPEPVQPQPLSAEPSAPDEFSSSSQRAVMVADGTGPATWAMGALFERLVDARQTAGQVEASIVTQPPGAGSPLHVHTRETELWYLLEGTMTYVAGDQTFHLAAGGFIYLPRAVPPAFGVPGPTRARFLGLPLPGKLMALYEEGGAPADERRLPVGGVTAADIAHWNELAPCYGVRVVG